MPRPPMGFLTKAADLEDRAASPKRNKGFEAKRAIVQRMAKKDKPSPTTTGGSPVAEAKRGYSFEGKSKQFTVHDVSGDLLRRGVRTTIAKRRQISQLLAASNRNRNG